MSKEYIDRSATVDALNKLCDRVCQYSKAQRKVMCGACPLGDAFTVIEDDLPAADVVEVRTGRWILNTVRDEWQQFHSDPECSECGFHPYYYHDHSVMKYCPNCGAKMDGGESDG